MSETRWTLGPWSRVDTPDYAEIHAPGTKQAVALVGTAEDADLIAAAPDLYAALVAALEYVALYESEHMSNKALAVHQKGRAALARARGEKT